MLHLSAQPCFNGPDLSKFNLLKQCLVYGIETDCRQIFKPVITDIGICCAVNTRFIFELICILFKYYFFIIKLFQRYSSK